MAPHFCNLCQSLLGSKTAKVRDRLLHVRSHHQMLRLISNDDSLTIDDVFCQCFTESPKLGDTVNAKSRLDDLCHSLFSDQLRPGLLSCFECGLELEVVMNGQFQPSKTIEHAYMHSGKSLVICLYCNSHGLTTASISRHLANVHQLSAIKGNYIVTYSEYEDDVGAMLVRCFGRHGVGKRESSEEERNRKSSAEEISGEDAIPAAYAIDPNASIQPGVAAGTVQEPIFDPTTPVPSSVVVCATGSDAAATALFQPLPIGITTSTRAETLSDAVTPSMPPVRATVESVTLADAIVAISAPGDTSEQPRDASPIGSPAKALKRTGGDLGSTEPGDQSKKCKHDPGEDVTSGQPSPCIQQQPPSVAVSNGHPASALDCQPFLEQMRQPSQIGSITAMESLVHDQVTRTISESPSALQHQQPMHILQAAQEQPQGQWMQQPQVVATTSGTMVLVKQVGATGASWRWFLPVTVCPLHSNSTAGPSPDLGSQQQPTQTTAVSMQTAGGATPPDISQECHVRGTAAATGQVLRSTVNAKYKPSFLASAPAQQATLRRISAKTDAGGLGKPKFPVTDEVRRKAQTVFGTADKLSLADKALILRFMAGDRENPHPRAGPVVTVTLSESQVDQTDPDGSSRRVCIGTYFKMNFDTGEWRHFRTTRPLQAATCKRLDGEAGK